VSKDRARPFSRKHRRYWIPVTGGMLLIGLIDISLGLCSYTPPSEVHERILLNVPNARGLADAEVAPQLATDCPPAIAARIESDMPGATIIACTPDRITLMRGEHKIDLEIEGTEIREVAETLTLPQIPATVMRAFAVAYPKTIPNGATKRTRRGADPIYELAFPPGAAHQLATLRADGTVIDLR
jgi:hypothetical protein